MSIVKRNDLVSKFHIEFSRAGSAVERSKVIRRFCAEAKRKYDHNMLDIAAIRKAVQCSQSAVPSESWTAIQPMLRAYEKGRPNYHLQNAFYIRFLVALWGHARLSHYMWEKASKGFLERLTKVGKRIHRWEDFVTRANAAMIDRHERAVHDATVEKIGYHKTQSRLKSPLTIADLETLMNLEPGTRLEELQSRIEAWLEPCRCLKARGTVMEDRRYAHFAIKKDEYGLLDWNPECSRLESCANCRRPSPPISPKRKQTGGLRPFGSAVKRPKQVQSAGTDCAESHSSEEPSHEALDLEDQTISSMRSESDSSMVPSVDAVADDRSNGKYPTPSWPASEQSMASAHSENSCIFSCRICAGRCILCEIPNDTEEADAAQMCEIAHVVSGNPEFSRASENLGLIAPLRFASIGNAHSPGSEFDVLSLSADAFEALANDPSFKFRQPILIREVFEDFKEYSTGICHRMLANTFTGMSFPTYVPGRLEPHMIPVLDVVEGLAQENSSASADHANIFESADVINFIKPRLTRMGRFSLLKRLHDRRRARAIRDSSQLCPTASDYLNFNIFSGQGACLNMQQDTRGPTWFRCLSGQKLWTFIASESMSQSDLGCQERDDQHWSTKGQARALIFQAGDVLFLPPGSLTIHGELSLSSSVVAGGTFWDQEDVISYLEGLAKQKNRLAPALIQETRSMALELADYLENGCDWDAEYKHSVSGVLSQWI